jgi:biotin transporter BioY
MRGFIKHTFHKEKLKEYLLESTVGNFIGFLVGSLVTTISTYHITERKGLKNLFGILPRKKVVVHMLPEWAEWAIATFVGFVVMQLVSYFINQKIYLELWEKAKNKWEQKDQNLNPNT